MFAPASFGECSPVAFHQLIGCEKDFLPGAAPRQSLRAARICGRSTPRATSTRYAIACASHRDAGPARVDGPQARRRLELSGQAGRGHSLGRAQLFSVTGSKAGLVVHPRIPCAGWSGSIDDVMVVFRGETLARDPPAGNGWRASNLRKVGPNSRNGRGCWGGARGALPPTRDQTAIRLPDARVGLDADRRVTKALPQGRSHPAASAAEA